MIRCFLPSGSFLSPVLYINLIFATMSSGEFKYFKNKLQEKQGRDVVFQINSEECKKRLILSILLHIIKGKESKEYQVAMKG